MPPKDSTDLVSKLRAYHYKAQNAPPGDPYKSLMRYGLDLLNGEVRDNVKAGCLGTNCEQSTQFEVRI